LYQRTQQIIDRVFVPEYFHVSKRKWSSTLIVFLFQTIITYHKENDRLQTLNCVFVPEYYHFGSISI